MSDRNLEISKEEEARYNELCLMALDFARKDEVSELEKMIKAGLNVNLKSAKGDTLLMLASYNNSINTVKMLIANGALVDERNDRGQTPLAGAAFKGYLDVVKALVEAGADINANNGMGATPHTFAVMFGRSEVAKYLLSVNKKPSLIAKIGSNLLSIFGKKAS
ncbi:ankyrin repeat domain-containing protein [Campylobacter sp. RM15925]|uniref:ankyrin repeat domain-containing protein n=1 Tax=Campylobacter sp. RM15925 TaxID=1705724 RepID=UPI0014758E36|nr:ankyrin repeat domain-containing protein [Campylobacter sp. RM15925]